MVNFKLVSDFTPTGDQPHAIEQLTQGLEDEKKFQTLLGATGTGKTFTMANVVANYNRPTLVLAPNKLLAAQLYQEYKDFFPDNAVHYYISYFDYYQPEAYLPQTGKYIEKDSSVNDQIQRYRLASTHALMTRSDVIVVASISCIYGIGRPDEWSGQSITVEKGMEISRRELMKKLINIQYERNDFDFLPGKIRVRGDVVDIFPGYLFNFYRVNFWGDEIESIYEMEPLRNEKIKEVPNLRIFPTSEYVTLEERIDTIVEQVHEELEERVQYFKKNGQYAEAQRLEERVTFDMAMLKETGYCKGIENYSRYIDQREAGEAPACLLDYFPDDYLMIIDESHLAIPQIHGMIGGEISRKENLIRYGFRLPSAMDNRPLRFEEWEERIGHVICTSATPADYEIEQSGGEWVDQVIRPTGLVDPTVDVRPVENQIDDLLHEINEEVKKGNRVLVTTLTKKLAERISEYYAEIGIKIQYLHSEIDTVERMEIVRDLRIGEIDVLIGINLLREGLDIPEVGLVAILDGDKAGFLRDTRSLIQTIGRASRNEKGRAIIYADKRTEAIDAAIEETYRRREKQINYNKEHGITPKTIKKRIQDSLSTGEEEEDSQFKRSFRKVLQKTIEENQKEDSFLTALEDKMMSAAKELDFEMAAIYRDLIDDIKSGKRTMGSVQDSIDVFAKKYDRITSRRRNDIAFAGSAPQSYDDIQLLGTPKNTRKEKKLTFKKRKQKKDKG